MRLQRRGDRQPECSPGEGDGAVVFNKYFTEAGNKVYVIDGDKALRTHSLK
ncbi:MAG: hypothetical protein ABW019_11195 [Chitinophagaceae bacterium]